MYRFPSRSFPTRAAEATGYTDEPPPAPGRTHHQTASRCTIPRTNQPCAHRHKILRGSHPRKRHEWGRIRRTLRKHSPSQATFLPVINSLESRSRLQSDWTITPDDNQSRCPLCNLTSSTCRLHWPSAHGLHSTEMPTIERLQSL